MLAQFQEGRVLRKIIQTFLFNQVFLGKLIMRIFQAKHAKKGMQIKLNQLFNFPSVSKNNKSHKIKIKVIVFKVGGILDVAAALGPFGICK